MFALLLVGLVFVISIQSTSISPDNASPPSMRQKDYIAKIVGGVPVDIHQFPHSVQVYNMGNMCGGNILNSYTVLTAAHCFDLNKDVSSVYIVSEARFSFDFNAPLHHVQLVKIHEGYNISRLFACDIALVFVKNPIRFSKVAQKAIIVNTDKWMNEKETKFAVAGWGWTKYEGEISKDGLLMAELHYVSLNECRRLHDMNFTEDMFCLYGDGQRDTCKGDSGGGVMWKGMIVGITSHGRKCSVKNSPSVYSNVWYFRSWIEKHIAEFAAEYCVSNKKKRRPTRRATAENEYYRTVR